MGEARMDRFKDESALITGGTGAVGQKQVAEIIHQAFEVLQRAPRHEVRREPCDH
jgi:FlaA1/EpsC-like NDP-sugar epimerase